MHYVTLASNFEFMQILSFEQIMNYPLLFVPFVFPSPSEYVVNAHKKGSRMSSEVEKMIVDSEGARKQHFNA